MIQQILQLQEHLNDKRYEYCAQHAQDGKKVIYFAYGLLTRECMFSTFNIWYALNNFSSKYRVIIGGIGTGDVPIDEHPINIPAAYQVNNEESVVSNLEWIVLPFVSYDLTEIIEKLRSQNQGVKIAYQVDFDFLNVSSVVPELKHYEENSSVIIENMRKSDRLIFANESLYRAAIQGYGDKLKGSGTVGTYNIPYINEQILEEIDGEKTDRKPEDPVRVGIICTKDNGADLMAFKQVWKAIHGMFKEKVLFILYGDTNSKITKAFAGVKTEFCQQTGIKTYYNELFNLRLDCLVIPTQDNAWNRAHYDIERVLEAQALGIPVVVSNIEPINKLIVAEKNGFICDDRDQMVKQLEIICEMDNSGDGDSILTRVARTAVHHISEAFDITLDRNIKKIEEVFL